jgi:hydroxypyruvate isomerase
MNHRWKLRLASHIGLNQPDDDGLFKYLAGNDPIDQIKFAAEQGFSGIEDNFLKLRPVEIQAKIGRTLEQHGLEMGCFVNHLVFDRPTFVSNEPEARAVILQQLKETIEVAKRVNGKYVTTVSGPFDLRLDHDYQTANMIENLKYCADLAESAGIVLGLEPITGKWWHGTFMTTIPHAYLMVKAVNSPAIKLIFDTFQAQMESGNMIENIDRTWDEIVCFQIADVPGRVEPTRGEMNYQTILKHIHSKGFTGLVEMEHTVSNPGLAGERAVLEIYDQLNQF